MLSFASKTSSKQYTRLMLLPAYCSIGTSVPIILWPVSHHSGGLVGMHLPAGWFDV